MGEPHPVELRERVVAVVEDGHPHCSAAAARFRVSVRFVNDMVILKRETEAVSPGARATAAGMASWSRCARGWRRKGDLALDYPVAELGGTL